MPNILYVILIAVVVVFAVRLLGAPSKEDRASTPGKLAQGALVLDVRTAGEFAGGHYEGATNIPVQELAGRVKELGPTNRAIVVYCRSGNRSTTAKAILTKAGFSDVTNAGGLNEMPRRK